jgi:hypothetical protein
MAAPRDTVFVGSAFVAKYPTGGGNFWVPLQYLLGLLDLGVDAYWVEYVWGDADPARARAAVDIFRRHAAALGIADRVTVVFLPDGTRDDPPGRAEHLGLAPDTLAARARAGLLLNLAGSVPRGLRAGYGRTALLDIDPGPFQIWARESDLGVGDHDAHLTIGLNLGAADSPVPLGEVAWRRVPPVVHLPSWPEQGARRGASWTTVTQWWNDQYAVQGGIVYDCNKRSGFLPLLSLPARVDVSLELAANVHPGETEDRAALAANGWRLVDPAAVAGTAAAFRRYVQGSRGELSPAKPAYVLARAGWVSDRTLCYLASGRPCVVEATGAEAHLPASAGLRFFATLDEAADALGAVERDYPAAARAARALAEEAFATRVTLPAVLAAAGA